MTLSIIGNIVDIFNQQTYFGELTIADGKIKTIDSNGIIECIPFEVKDEAHKIYCTKCFSANVGMVSGCSEPTCFDCGYSKCS